MTTPYTNIVVLNRTAVRFFGLLLLCVAQAMIAGAHPLGNFTINHFARITTSPAEVRIHYVVDMAEIPTFQVSQQLRNSVDGSIAGDALELFLGESVEGFVNGLWVTADTERVPLETTARRIAFLRGDSGLPTLRIEVEFKGKLSQPLQFGQPRRMHYEDTNFNDRIGWREIVIQPLDEGSHVFNSTAFGSALTDGLKTYPQDRLMVPLNEDTADWSVTSGEIPPGSTTLLSRDGNQAVVARDRFAELIAVQNLTPWMAFLGLLIAAGLGALHAFSPGHGKTVVAAYLVGSRGTARHAAFLGITVTVTHTLGVFALGLVTLFATAYVVPERLFPILSFISGVIVFSVGLTLFAKRLRAPKGGVSPLPEHDHGGHSHAHGHHHHHVGRQRGEAITHSHGGRVHSHLPPGAGDTPVTWRSLLALGISGGLLPCPSALVVLLSAIALNRVGYGLALVVGFSVGLACTLTAVGLVFVYLGRFIKAPVHKNRLVRILPVISALVIAFIGVAICYEALVQSGFEIAPLTRNLVVALKSPLSSNGGVALLGLGLIFGLKHATEVDHIVAVSTIVSEHRSLKRAALVGGLWGAGHTAALVAVGVIVLLFRIAIPEGVSSWLEFAVALMIIGLGANVVLRSILKRSNLHMHRHEHNGTSHLHMHFHEGTVEHSHDAIPHSHRISGIGFKPLIVGAVHGLAGSGALTLLVLVQVNSAGLGLLYLAVFGLGSVLGMMLTSLLVGLPFTLSSSTFKGLNQTIEMLAGMFSIAFGLWYAYQTASALSL